MAGKQVRMTRSKRCLLALFTLVIGLFGSIGSAYAAVPYDTYSYNFWQEPVEQPHAYLYTRTLSADSFGSALSYPQDMFLYEDLIYIADTGNSRILKVNDQGEVLLEITCADGKNDPLNQPQGVFVTDEGHIFIADSGNKRIVELDEKGKFLREIGRPETDLIADTQDFVPTKVVVDGAGRIYSICYGINLGLVEFNYSGEFQGFMGAAEVSVSTFDYIWKNYFSTAAQQERMETIIPTEYSNIFVDQEDFIYATISNLSMSDFRSSADQLRRLNPTGTDVLRRLSNSGLPICGDPMIQNGEYTSFVDVAATTFGCYYVLDSTRGRIFTYDYDGNVLFAFGKNGSREGNTQKPVAIGLSSNEDRVYVLDNLLGSILVFDVTDYGSHVLNALELNNKGDSEGSYAEWQEVLKQNANMELAYVGIGKTYLTEGNYQEAMKYFELGNSRKYYSRAFQFYRKELMEEYFGWIMAAIGVVVVVVVLVRGVKKFRRWEGEVRCLMSKR